MSIQGAINSTIGSVLGARMQVADLKAKQQMANQRAQNIKEAKEHQKEHLTYFGGKFYKEVKV